MRRRSQLARAPPTPLKQGLYCAGKRRTPARFMLPCAKRLYMLGQAQRVEYKTNKPVSEHKPGQQRQHDKRERYFDSPWRRDDENVTIPKSGQ